MRRSVLAAILAGALSFVACSDQPTEVPSRPESPQASPQADVGTTPCTLNQLIDLTAKLFPPSPQRNAIVAALKALPTNRQLRLAAVIRRVAFGIIDIFTRAYAAGRLVRSPDTPANLLAFIQGMYCFVGLTPPPTPPGPIDPNEFATAVITQNSGPMNVVTPSQHGGLSFQGLTLPAGVPAVTVFVYKLPDSPGPLFTSLDQYPLFYEFSVFPKVTFTKDVIAGVCQSDFFPVSSSLLLAHNVGPNFGDVEILPFVSPGFLNCANITPPPRIGFFGGVRGFFASVFLPAPLHAATSLLVTTGTGGRLKVLSPFGSVNPNSNAASISPVDQSGEPTDGQVDEPGLVYVKATSQNDAPIQKVPVTFDGETTVLTGEDGIASFEWDATPGTTLTATVPNETGCPAIAEGATPPYRPRVCFTPSSVTFTAPAADDPIVLNVTAVEKLPGGTQNFFVQSGGPGPYIWSVNGVDGGDATFGIITTSGDYTAPASVPSPATFDVCARREANPLNQACASVTIQPVPSSGADIIVFNDLNMLDNTAASDPNNIQLFKNLVNFTATGSHASGNSVLIHQGHASRCGTGAACGGFWTSFVSTLSGDGYTVINGSDQTTPLTSIGSDVKVILLAMPTTSYSDAEINSLKAFAGAGGRIVFVGEHAGFYGDDGIAVENAFLVDMGAEMENTGGSVDCGYNVLPASSLRDHQVTAGLDQLTIACASVVEPGPNDYPLFYSLPDLAGQQVVLGAVAKIDLTPLPGLRIATPGQMKGNRASPLSANVAADVEVFSWGFRSRK